MAVVLPSRDTTRPELSYGAGRYLFDTIKGQRDFCGGQMARETDDAGLQLRIQPLAPITHRWFCPLAPR